MIYNMDRLDLMLDLMLDLKVLILNINFETNTKQ